MEIQKFIIAFIVGGAICALTQLLIDLTKLTPARILVLLVTLGVFLGGTGVYTPLIDLAGAGATVPLTGFGANVAKGVREAVDKDGLLGVLSGPLTAAATGCSAALIFGYLACLIFKGRPKRSFRIIKK